MRAAIRRFLVALPVLAGLLLTPLAVLAANTPATIVSCSTATACYSPDPIRLTVGSTVTWTNSHTLTHTATADSGAWDTGALGPGATSGPITFTTAGTFAYHCRFHSDMHGTIIVSAAAATPAPTSAPLRRLAQGGGGPATPPDGPAAPIALGLVLSGLVVLATHPRRRARARVTRRAASDEAPR
jgi:plastocyanin